MGLILHFNWLDNCEQGKIKPARRWENEASRVIHKLLRIIDNIFNLSFTKQLYRASRKSDLYNLKIRNITRNAAIQQKPSKEFYHALESRRDQGSFAF